jgi:hypothetical protein
MVYRSSILPLKTICVNNLLQISYNKALQEVKIKVAGTSDDTSDGIRFIWGDMLERNYLTNISNMLQANPLPEEIQEHFYVFAFVMKDYFDQVFRDGWSQADALSYLHFCLHCIKYVWVDYEASAEMIEDLQRAYDTRYKFFTDARDTIQEIDKDNVSGMVITYIGHCSSSSPFRCHICKIIFPGRFNYRMDPCVVIDNNGKLVKICRICDAILDMTDIKSYKKIKLV